MSETPRAFGGFALLLHVLAGLLLLFVVAPIAGLLLHTSGGELADTAADPEVRRSITLTLWSAMAATLAMGLFAIPLGYVFARREFPLKRILSALIDIPIVIPHSAAGIAILGLLTGDGLIARTTQGAGLSFVGSALGIVVAMAYVSVPFLVNAAREGFAAVPERLEKAALNLGASPLRVFFTVSLPLARRSLLSGVVLMWGRGMSEFGAVMIIAYHPMVTPVLIWERFTRYGLDHTRPLALIFIAVCLAVFLLLRLFAGPQHHAHRS